MKRIGVVGAGAWGTALACVAARAGDEERAVSLWAREEEVVKSISATRLNDLYLPGIEVEKNVTATNDYADLHDVEAILFVAPAQHARAVMKDLATNMDKPVPLIICSKGIERGTLKMMTEVIGEVAPEYPQAILSGPSFAADVAMGMPTAVTLACSDAALGAQLQQVVGLATFRPYLSDDPIGAELGGSVKNVLAIACGIVEGKHFGESARAALTTRGFAELVRLGVAMGAKRETMGGLSGLGDLVLTCNSKQSRNMSLGFALGQGRSLDNILGARNSVTEGVYSAQAVVALAKKHNIEMPIAEAVDAIISGEKSLDKAIIDLLNRPFKSEV